MLVNLRFAPIDLSRHAAICVRFRRDAFVCSFGNDGRFERDSGDDGAGYLRWLSERLAELPDGCVHVWLGDEIIGQMEMRPRNDSRVGYVNLFYLKASERGKGYGPALHEYAAQVFRKISMDKLNLKVSPTNVRAVRFYVKCGWADLGPVPDQPDVHLMEFRLDRRP